MEIGQSEGAKCHLQLDPLLIRHCGLVLLKLPPALMLIVAIPNPSHPRQQRCNLLMAHTCQGLCSNGSVKYPLLRTLNTALSKKEKGEEPEPEEEVGRQYSLKFSPLAFQSHPFADMRPRELRQPSIRVDDPVHRGRCWCWLGRIW